VTKHHAVPRSRQSLLDEPLFREGGQCLACAEDDVRPDSESGKVFHGRALVSHRFLPRPRRGREHLDPQHPLFFLVADPEGAFSIVKCISGARENARQVRAEISSEMGEQPNTLFHGVSGLELQPDEDDDADAVRVGKADTQLPVRVRVTPSPALLPRDEEFASDQEWSQFLDETQQLQLVTAQPSQ
jgi:hypothetical protein